MTPAQDSSDPQRTDTGLPAVERPAGGGHAVAGPARAGGAAPKAMSWLRQIGGVAVIAVAAGGAWLLLGQSDAGNGAPGGFPGGDGGDGKAGPPVVTEAVALADNTQTLRAIGTGEALRSITLFPPDDGEVTLVLFTSGGTVVRDDPLLALDAREQELAVDLARLQMEEQERTVARNEQLSGTVSASAAQAARTALAEARNRLAAAQLALDRRTLLAPFEGIVGMTEVSEGDRVTTTTPIATLDDRSALLIDFSVPERFAAQVAIGQAITATTSALPGEVFEGRISAVDSRLDPELRTLAVEATVPNDADRLRAGLSFSVELSFAATAHPSVPELAVQWSRDGAYVWRVAGGMAEQVPVGVIERSNGRILVSGGLAPGDRVVVEGTQRLREGRPVDDVTAGGAPQAPPSAGVGDG